MAVTLPSVYQDGTATVAANGIVVTGQSTLWSNAVLPGDFFGVHKGYAIRVLSVDSNTQLTLANPWPGGAQTAAHYEIMLCPDASRMQETSRQLLQQLGNGNIAALSGLVGAADALPYFTGSGTMALTGLTATGRDIIDSANVSAAQTALGVSDYIKGLLNDADASTALSTLGVSAFIKTLLDDTDAATARGTLGAQAALGYTPVQQGTGVGQGANAIKIGYDSANARLKATVDTTDLGAIWTDSKGTATLGSPLFVKLPNGLILQAFALAQASSDYSAAFPTAFPTACLGVWFNQTFGITTSQFIGISTSNITKTVFDIRTRNISNGGTVAGVVSVPVIVFAIGF